MFNITIEQSILMKALEFIEPTVGKNANQLGDNCICMSTTGNNSVALYTTNTVEFTKVEVIVSLGGNTQEFAPYVDFKRFKGIIASIPANEMVSVTATPNSIEITYGLKKKPIVLMGCTNGMLPLPSINTSDMITVPKEVIQTALGYATAIIEDNESAPIYNCLRIATQAMEFEFTAIDTIHKRIFAYTTQGTQNNRTADMLIEASKLKKSMKIFEDFHDLNMYTDGNAIYVEGDSMNSSSKTNGMITSVQYYTRCLSGAFPTTIKSHFNQLPSEFCEILKDDINATFARVKALEDGNSNGCIAFTANNTDCTIAFKSSYGNTEDVIALNNAITNNFSTIFKYQNISDILKVVGTDTFDIGAFANNPNNFVIKPHGINNVLFTVPAMVGASNP